MIVVGIGCRKGATTDAIDAALAMALTAAGIEPGSLSAIATGGIKADEPGIAECAKRRGLELIVVRDEALKDTDPRCLTRSEASQKSAGVGSLSEAAALAVAGTGGRLLGPRIVHDGVTCAFARSADAARQEPPLRLGSASTPLPHFVGGEDKPAARLDTNPLPLEGAEVSRRSRDGEGVGSGKTSSRKRQ